MIKPTIPNQFPYDEILLLDLCDSSPAGYVRKQCNQEWLQRNVEVSRYYLSLGWIERDGRGTFQITPSGKSELIRRGYLTLVPDFSKANAG